MNKPNEPTPESLEEMPEIEGERFQRRPGRGHHANRQVGPSVMIDADLWSHFGSAEAVNAVLREWVEKKSAG